MESLFNNITSFGMQSHIILYNRGQWLQHGVIINVVYYFNCYDGGLEQLS